MMMLQRSAAWSSLSCYMQIYSLSESYQIDWQPFVDVVSSSYQSKNLNLIPFLKTTITTIAVYMCTFRRFIRGIPRLQEITCHWNPHYFPVSLHRPPQSFPCPQAFSVSYNPLNNVQCYQHRRKNSGIIQHSTIHCSSVFA